MAARMIKYDSRISREARKDLMGKHAFETYPQIVFRSGWLGFWGDGYRASASIREVGTRDRGLFPSLSESNFDGGGFLTNVRLFPKPFG